MKFSKEDSGQLVYTMNTAIAKKCVSDNEVIFWQYVIAEEEPERQSWFSFVYPNGEETIVCIN